MQFLRSQLWVALFFCLISVGQAYPYSSGWSLTGETVCSCRREGHDCIHGCPRKPASTPVTEHAGHHGHQHHQELSAQGRVESSHSSDLNIPKIVKRPCGARASQDVLSFRGDPFLPSTCKLPILNLQLQKVIAIVFSDPNVFIVPETPPPRQA